MAFREEARDWLEENCPASIRTPTPEDEFPSGGRRATFKNPDTKVWMDRMASRGWTAPTWPTEYGGGGLSKDENRILSEELQKINARPALTGMGLSMIGPALLEYGNEEQCHEHLPQIVRGDIWWCQGYSEPGSGSDLASLRTKAVEDGDDYIINGSKIWTSGADRADWIFCLVRTDQDVPKHEGITFILFDMASEGVTVKPIRLISGFSPFCETFFDDVRVPRKNVVTQPGGGWTVAKRLLQYERTSIGGIGGSNQRAATIEEIAKVYAGEENGKIADPDLRARILEHRITDKAYALTVRRSSEESKSTKAPSFVSSMFKLYGTEQNIRRLDLLTSMMGTQGVGWAGEGFAPNELAVTRQWLRSKANSIEGGSSEVQLNIIAKRILGLPD
ncbi:MAG: acyl-CoA dehydrogenase family protein [Gammaproteobacteria bacterium]|nr:acyl-CoA dehydrogenase family protein [Gammaproteobacteria bacterium]